MTATLLDAPTTHTHDLPVVQLSALRPLHAIDLAGLTLDIDGLTRGHELTRAVRTRRWALRRLTAPGGADRRSYVVLWHGRVVGVALLDDLRRAPVCAAQVSMHLDLPADAADAVRAETVRVAALEAAALGLHRLEAAVLPEDEAARRALVAAGFSAVGLARDYRLVDGRWRDHVLLERLLGGTG